MAFIAALLSACALAGTLPPIQFDAVPQGNQEVYVVWSGITTSQAVIYRDGTVDAVFPNPNFYGHSATLAGEPTGSHTYKACETSTALKTGRCSQEVTITVT